jgi:aerobic carbon-monoxide dehydrogenase large subunit
VHRQVHGGIVQGVGQALMGDACYDLDTAQPIAGSFMDYAMPRADRVPYFDCDLSEVPSLTHPLGIRPAGEGGTTRRSRSSSIPSSEMPATSEQVWRAIRAAQQDRS